MRIFITGVAGFLGSHIAKRMLASGHEVVGVDNLVGGFLDNVPNEVEFYVEDCINIHKIMEYTKGCDTVFHAACTAHEGVSVFSPFFITKNTYQITMSVLSAAIQNKIKKFIYCSSMARYGSQKTLPFHEDMVCNPQDPYGIAKYVSELTIKNLAELNNMQYVILVPHNIYGPGQNYTDPYRNVISIMINRMLQGKPPVIYGTGNQKRCFSYVDDVSDSIEDVILSDGLNGEIINIGPDNEFITINELVEKLNNHMGCNYKSIYMPMRPLEVEKAYCSSEKVKALFGYASRTNLDDGLKEMIKYISGRGAKEFVYDNLPIEIDNELTPKTWTKKLI